MYFHVNFMSSEAYVPVYHEETDSWYPSNRAADLLVHLNHILRDIGTVNELRIKERHNNPIVDKLLFKYELIELASFTKPLKELLAITMKSPRLTKRKPAPLRYVTRKDIEDIKRSSRTFYQKLDQVQLRLARIRNEIGAHRELKELHHNVILWRSIEPAEFVEVINAAIPLIKRLGDLNIYNWGRSFGDGSISMFGTHIIDPWEEAFETEDS